MFCTNCGKNIPDGSQFCPECGATQETQPAYAAPAGTYAPPAYTPPATGKTVTVAGKTFPAKLLAIAGAVVVGVVVLILLCSALFGGGRETPLKNYCKAYGKANVSAFLKLYPEEVLDEVYDWDSDDKDDIQDYLDDGLDDMEDIYGEDITMSYEIKTEKELNDKRLKALGEYLEDNYDMDADELSAGYVMQVKWTIEGDDDSDNSKNWVVVYKYDGDWYMDTYATYMVSEISTLTN